MKAFFRWALPFYLLISLLWASLSSAREAQQVVLSVIYHSENDTGALHLDSHKILSEKFVDELLKIDPKLKSKVVIASTKEELKSKLSEILDPDDVVSYLFIGSHGGRSLGPSKVLLEDENAFSLNSKAPDARIIFRYSKRRDWSSDEMLTRNQEVADLFRAVRGRFSVNPVIIVPACNVLCANRSDWNASFLASLSEILSLKSFSFFGLESLGSFPVILTKLPFQLPKRHLSKKLVTIFDALIGVGLVAGIYDPRIGAAFLTIPAAGAGYFFFGTPKPTIEAYGS